MSANGDVQKHGRRPKQWKPGRTSPGTRLVPPVPAKEPKWRYNELLELMELLLDTASRLDLSIGLMAQMRDLKANLTSEIVGP